jgi:hypothetical protein
MPITQSSLAERCRLARPSADLATDRLVTRRCVACRISAKDRRTRLAGAARAGLGPGTEFNAARSYLFVQLPAALTQAERGQLIELPRRTQPNVARAKGC